MIGTSKTREIIAIVEQIKPLLAGQKPEVIAAVLADLMAILLAGHYAEGDENETRKMRAELLAMHCAKVRELTRINAEIMGTTP
jgi:hypothetical protein